MTQDEIIEMAKQAQFPIFGTKVVATDPMQQIMADVVTQHYHYSAIQFAKLVAEREREECAEVCKKHADVYVGIEQNPTTQSAWAACIDNRDAIRARGQA